MAAESVACARLCRSWCNSAVDIPGFLPGRSRSSRCEPTAGSACCDWNSASKGVRGFSKAPRAGVSWQAQRGGSVHTRKDGHQSAHLAPVVELEVGQPPDDFFGGVGHRLRNGRSHKHSVHVANVEFRRNDGRTYLGQVGHPPARLGVQPLTVGPLFDAASVWREGEGVEGLDPAPIAQRAAVGIATGGRSATTARLTCAVGRGRTGRDR